MKGIYRGYEIEAVREDSLGGDDNLYYRAYRVSDGLAVVDDFTMGSDPEEEFYEFLKVRVDKFIESKGASEEMADEY